MTAISQHGRSLVEKNAHVGSDGGQTRFRKLQHPESLLAGHAGKPLQEQSMVALSSRFSNSSFTGTRVPRKPLTAYTLESPSGLRRSMLDVQRSTFDVSHFFLSILWVLNAVLVIIAAIQASDGKFNRYPMTIRFIQ